MGMEAETVTSQSTSSPRNGPLGVWDRLVGPAASRTEQTLVLAFGVAVTTAVLYSASAQSVGWTLAQQAVVAFLAMDLAGGIVANTTASGVQWWHRPSQRPRDHFVFVAFHIYPLVLPFVFATVSWTAGVIVYGYLLAGAAVILLGPSALRRPIAMSVTAGGIALGSVSVTLGPGLEWFVPFLYLKLLGGHLAVGE